MSATTQQSSDASGEVGTKLFTPVNLGDISLGHRIVMAPMTRLRADPETSVQPDMAVEYYAQRATEGGLIISESISPSKAGRVWAVGPGLWSDEQVESWKKITDAVHAKGGKIIAQLAMAGRVATPGLEPEVWAASDIANPDPGATRPPLHVMTEADIQSAIQQYTGGAENAIRAGFDGVEVHCANGYLLDQFIQSNSNQRTDAYGGSLSNRFRFPIAVIRSIASAIGAQKVGVRISPFGKFQGMRERNPLATFVPFVEQALDAVPDLAYFHGLLPRVSGDEDQPEGQLVQQESIDPIREVLVARGVPFIVAGGFGGEEAKAHTAKYDDLVAFGRPFTSNPDLYERVKHNYPLEKYDRSTFYTQDARGYIDWTNYTPEDTVVPVSAVPSGIPVKVSA